jgi:N-acyl-D-amino-acid deacylase
VQGMLDQIFSLGNPPNYEPGPEQTIARIVAERGQELHSGAYDMFLEDDGHALFLMASFNYFEGNHEVIRQQLTHPWSVSGLSDGGAHCGMISDGSNPTFMLTHWARDRSRGETLPLPWVIKKQTLDTARLFGLGDRGVLQPGKKADLNIIDHDRLTLHAPRMAHDLPAGGRRLLQTADGYDYTIVSGEITRQNGADTGARPGRLIRGAR